MGRYLIEHDSISLRQFSSFVWLQSLWICLSKRAIVGSVGFVALMLSRC